MPQRRSFARVGFAWLLVGLCACASSTFSGVRTDASDGGAPDAPGEIDAAADAPEDMAPDLAPPPVVCGDAVCTAGSEDCETCPLDCNACPVCDMAPTCTGALAVPTSTTAMPMCDNTAGDDERTNYACGAGVGVPPDETTCADPQLRIRLRDLTIMRGWFDVARDMYCVITAEDGAHSELLITTPREVRGNNIRTNLNFRLSEGLAWGQGDLYRSISNITVTYACYLTSNTERAMGVLNEIAGRAAEVSEHADGYGWVFGTVSVLGTIIGSSLGTIDDRQILDVQQTLDASALLDMTNGRSWQIRSHHGNLDLSGVWDMTLTMESWGCADVRTVLE